MEQDTISLTGGAKYKNYPFYGWVPKPLGIILLILLFIPILTVSGVYTANSGEMTSGLGIQSEHIQFVGFVTSIGMAAFSPFFYQLVCIRREKMMCVVGFSVMYLLSYVCAVTDSIFVLALCSLVMGFLRMVLMMVNLFTLIRYAFGMEATQNITPGNEPVDEEGWDRLDSEKSKSMPIIYLFFMILGQLGTSLTAWLAYEYQWQDVYYYMMGMTLVAILIVLVTMPYHAYNNRRFPITFRKFGNVAVFSSMMTCGIYVLVYGKTLDWFADPTIVRSTILTVVFAAVFFYMEWSHRSPYFLMDVFRLFPNKIQKPSGVRRPLLRRKNGVLRGRHPQKCKDFQSISPIGQNQHARRILIKKCLILIQIKISEHLAVVHMVAIQQGIIFMKGIITSGIQKNTSGKRKISIYVRIYIGKIIFTLQDRVIDLRIVQRKPCAYIGINGKQFLKGRAFLLCRIHFRFQRQQFGLHVVHCSVHLRVIPQGISGIESRYCQKQDHSCTHEGISRP